MIATGKYLVIKMKPWQEVATNPTSKMDCLFIKMVHLLTAKNGLSQQDILPEVQQVVHTEVQLPRLKFMVCVRRLYRDLFLYSWTHKTNNYGFQVLSDFFIIDTKIIFPWMYWKRCVTMKFIDYVILILVWLNIDLSVAKCRSYTINQKLPWRNHAHVQRMQYCLLLKRGIPNTPWENTQVRSSWFIL